MKTKEFENFFFYLTDKCRVLKGKEIAPEQISTWEIVFAPVAFQDAIAAVNYWIGNETFTPTPAELISVIRGEWERRNRLASQQAQLDSMPPLSRVSMSEEDKDQKITRRVFNESFPCHRSPEKIFGGGRSDRFGRTADRRIRTRICRLV